jgi:hypothetical protein
VAFTWQQLAKPPAPDQIEITVIGPGFGECIVVHTGSGRWLIVDSCRDPKTKEPVALRYLQTLGLNPSSCVDWVVATHWHADHIAGISEIMSACSGAQFCCALVLAEREFILYASLSRPVVEADKAGEFRAVLRQLRERGLEPRWAKSGSLLHSRAAQGSQPTFRIVALSPSDKEYSLFLARVASQGKKKGMPHRAYVDADPNLAAVVLSLEWGNQAVLLGADLLADSASDRGWLAAVAESKVVGGVPGSLVKIPHHGSAGAHCPGMWSDLLLSRPVSVITPYSRGRKEDRPPKRSDLDRISRLSSVTALTAPTQSGRARKPSSPVALGLSQSHIKMRTLGAGLGIARFRTTQGNSWGRELFGRAKLV